MMQEKVEINNITRSYIYSMECSVQRMKWYMESGETRHLVDSEMYLRAANVLMKEICQNDAKNYKELVA